MVRLVIKAPNQKIDDCEVRGAELGWTVAQLKDHLSRHYPSHPAPHDQRLIYSGHLMRDEQTLSQVFGPSLSDVSSSEVPDLSDGISPSTSQSGGGTTAEEETVTLHLVCRHIQSPAQPQSSAAGSSGASSSSSSSGRSNRPTTSQPVTASNVTSTASSMTPAAAAAATTASPLFTGMMAQQPHIVWTPEQLALAHQMYQQFVSQLNSNPAAAAAVVATAGLPPNGLRTGFPLLAPSSMPSMIPVPSLTTTMTVPVVPPVHVPVVGAGGVAAAAAPVDPQADLIRNIIQNNNHNNNNVMNQAPVAAAAPPVEDDDDDVDPEDREERDFLGWFYWLSRAVVLFSVVYFYSSLARFFIVVLFAMLMYLYQAGVFVPRMDANQMFDERLVGGENEAPAAAAAPAPGPQDQQDMDQQNRQLYQQQDAGAPDQRQQQQHADPAVAAAAAATRRRGSHESESDGVTERSGLRMVWLIVSSLFTSLIPEQPAAQFN